MSKIPYSNVKVLEKGNKLRDMPEEGDDTLYKLFMKPVKRVPHSPYLGTRNDAKEGRPYEWKNYQEVHDIS